MCIRDRHSTAHMGLFVPVAFSQDIRLIYADAFLYSHHRDEFSAMLSVNSPGIIMLAPHESARFSSHIYSSGDTDSTPAKSSAAL